MPFIVDTSGRLRLAFPPLLVLSTACVLTTDLSYDPGAGGAASSPASSGAGTSDAASTGSPSGPTTGTGGASNGSTATSAVSSGGGEDGGGGAGGRETCVLPGEGVPGASTSHARVLGPARGPLTSLPDLDAALDGQRVVFAGAVVAPEGQATLFEGEPLVPAGDRAVVLGWADEDGTSAAAWTVANAPLETFTFPVVDVVSAGPGRVYLAASHATTSFRVLEIDLCTREETTIASCEGALTQSAQVAADAEGRIAFSFNNGHDGTPTCSILPPGCAQPAMGVLDTVVWLVDTDGSCASTVLKGAGEPAVPSYQTGVSLAIDGGSVHALGNYDGAMFSGDAAIDTGAGADVFDVFLTRLARTGSTLTPVDAWDMGRLTYLGGKGLVVTGEGAGRRVRVAATLASAVAPRGPFVGGTIGATDAGIEVLSAALSTVDGSLTYGRWLGGPAVDTVTRLHATPDGVLAAGRTGYECGDPIDDDGDGGCAYFVRIDEQGDATPALQVIEAIDPGKTDLGLAALARPAGVWALGVTEGAVEVVGRVIPAAGPGLSSVYLVFDVEP